MVRDRQRDLTVHLQQLMQQVGINSFKELARSTKTSTRTINKLRFELIDTIQLQVLVRISNVLNISLSELIEIFGDRSIIESKEPSIKTLQQEYQLLHQQFQQQQETLQSEFQFQSLQILESFLTYFPSAKYAAQNNPDFPASKIFPLMGSIDRLIQSWGITIIGEIGSEIPYDPHWHQLIAGTANPEELVTVRYIGYRQSDKLIFRAKVSNSIV